MPDILIRNISDGVAAALQAHAAATGQTQQQYLSALLEGLAQQPIVRARYALKAIGPDGTHATLCRGMNGLEGQGATNMSQAQANAYRQAKLLVERNAPGDRERAIGLLASVFEDVFEVAG